MGGYVPEVLDTAPTGHTLLLTVVAWQPHPPIGPDAPGNPVDATVWSSAR